MNQGLIDSGQHDTEASLSAILNIINDFPELFTAPPLQDATAEDYLRRIEDFDYKRKRPLTEAELLSIVLFNGGGNGSFGGCQVWPPLGSWSRRFLGLVVDYRGGGDVAGPLLGRWWRPEGQRACGGDVVGFMED